MRHRHRPLGKRRERGGALVPALVVIILLAGMSAALMQVGLAEHRGVRSSREESRAFYLAEAGIARAVGELAASAARKEEAPKNLGAVDTPVIVARTDGVDAGAYWVDLVPSAQTADSYTITSTGTSLGKQRTLRVTAARQAGQLFTTAIFAGNSSGDTDYSMRFGGTNAQADQINGDVYSGGDILVEGHAVINGEATAAGKILGHEDKRESVVSYPPDIAAMRYDVNHTFNVNAAFDGPDAYWAWDENGGNAWQLPEDDPAHIFRKNPDDRTNVLHRNGKDDYFLEDPYEPLGRDPNQDGTSPNPVTVTGTLGNPGPNGNQAVYYIDGNLWLHNSPVYSYQMAHDFAGGLQVTFVVKGNITFSDNVFYQDPDLDGVAFIAIVDPDVPDSGNIYFGDPQGGTLEYMDGFMYAEHDFYDYNLGAHGSRNVHVNGIMSAGNQVAIERGLGANHSQLVIDFDPRVNDGSLELPGLPEVSTAVRSGYVVTGWMEVPRAEASANADPHAQ